MIGRGDRVAVTGASGFIGRYLMDDLRRAGYEPVSVGRGSQSDRQTDYSLASLTAALEGVAAVVHLAGRTVLRQDDALDLEPYWEPNVSAVGSLAKAAKAAGVTRVVFASSRSVYSGFSVEMYKEGSVVYPANAYGLSKLTAESYLEMLTRGTPVSALSLRLAAVYGYGERGTPAIMKFINQALARDTLVLTGNPTYAIDQLYVRDATAALVAALRASDVRGVYNVGGGRAWRVHEIAELVNEVFGNDGNMRYETDTWEALTPACMDISRVRTELGWSPAYELRSGLEDFKATRGAALEKSAN